MLTPGTLAERFGSAYRAALTCGVEPIVAYDYAMRICEGYRPIDAWRAATRMRQASV